MSTATIAAGGNSVRPLAAIRSDMGRVLANKPESLIADAKAALAWLPRKAYNIAIRTLRWLQIPQFASFLQRNLARFVGVVGVWPLSVEIVTSPWGQKTLTKTISISSKIISWSVRTSWKIVTSPFRLFTPTRNLVQRIETAVDKVNNKLTPDSGETFGVLQVLRDVLGYQLSSERTYMKFTRTTAIAVMTVRVTRRFVPVGWLRIATYILDGILIARAYDDVLAGTWLGKRLDRAQKVVEQDVKRSTETVNAEVQHLTHEAASDVADKLRDEATETQMQGATAASQQRSETIIETQAKAAEKLAEADSLETAAEQLDAPANQPGADTALKVVETPKPSPAVPPMGGRTPSTGPQRPAHQRHDSGKGKPR